MPAIRHFFLDLEGTIVRDKNYEPIQGAVNWVNGLKDRGLDVLVASNNTTHAAREIRRRLVDVGFRLDEPEVLTCALVGIEILKEWGARSCLVIGEDSLRAMLAEAGFQVDEEGRAEAVVVGLDRGLTYERLSRAVDALLRQHVPLLALHYNRLYLGAGGVRGPSVGAVVRALEYASRVQAVVAGKPSRRFYDTALRRSAARAEEVLFVSDDPFSDLVGARRVGMKTAFVLSGKYPSDDVLESIEPAMRPNIVVSSIGEIEVVE
jgi:HAD superfamily hydrolase (TIGR01450 family)